jgi:autoinducer 2-degrading protein
LVLGSAQRLVLLSSAYESIRLNAHYVRATFGIVGIEMIIVHVHVRVNSDAIEQFQRATVENATESIREPGIARFDVLQDSADPSRFLLIEVYRYPEAPAEHKATRHYQTWRDAVADMMAEPRKSVKYQGIFPNEGS